MKTQNSYGRFIEAGGELSKQISFLSRAVKRANDGAAMNFILVEPSDVEADKRRGVSTDGRRLHIVDPFFSSEETVIESGLWRPLKTGGEFSWIAQLKDYHFDFLPYRKVIPRDEPLSTFILDGLPRGEKREGMNTLVQFFREFPEPTVINLNYLRGLDCYSASTSKKSIKISIYSSFY
jgi:hypothetical protein